MITRTIEFSTPANKPAFVEYKISGNADWVVAPGTQPKSPPTFDIDLEEGQYYDFRLRTFCGPDDTDLSPWVYIGPIFSRYACQSPTTFNIFTPPPGDNNDSIFFTWEDDKLLDGIPNLTYEIKLYNSAGTQVGPTMTGPYVYEVPNIGAGPRDNQMIAVHQYLLMGVYKGLPPDTYTAIMTIMCYSGARPTIQASFKKNSQDCPMVAGLTYVENIAQNDTDPNNTFNFTWTLNPLATKGYNWAILQGYRAGQRTVVSGKTNPGVNFVNGVSLPKGQLYEFRVWAVCQYSESSTYTSLSFEANFPTCSIGSLNWPDPTVSTVLGLTLGTPNPTIRRIQNTTNNNKKVSIYIKFYFTPDYPAISSVIFTNTPIGIISDLCRPLTTKVLTGTNSSVWTIQPNGQISLSTSPVVGPIKGQMYTYILQADFELI